MKHLSLIFLLFMLASAAFAVTATWTGNTSVNWDTSSNWSTGALPTGTTDVIIPNTTRKPRITWVNALCNNLTIQSSAVLYLDSTGGYGLTVNGDMTVNGALTISGTGGLSVSGLSKCYGPISVTGTGGLTAYGDIRFYSGSSFVDSADTQFQVHRDLTLDAGSNFVMNHGGRTNIVGTGNTNIRNFNSATQFGYLIAAKTVSAANYYVNIHGDSTQPFKVNKDLINFSGNRFSCTPNITVTVLGNVEDQNAVSAAVLYGIKWEAGTIKMDGVNQYLTLAGPGCYLNNLTCSATTAVFTDYALTIKGNLVIESGVFNPLNKDVLIAGDWINPAGPSAFIEGTGKVVFNGSGVQNITASETFYRINVNKTGGILWVNSGTATVTFENYDWTAGAIGVSTGTLNIDDLVDTGLYGGYYVDPGATINISDPGGSLDLKNVTMVFNYGGTININGTTVTSSWQQVNLNMSGTNSLLAFNGFGIFIDGSSSYTPSFNISGGTIRTSGIFQNNRSTFAPAGGTIELVGTSSTNLSLTAGSLYDLKINKTGTAAAVLGNDMTCRHDVNISSGILSLGSSTLNCNGNADITGTLSMNNALSTFTVLGDIIWNVGAEEDTTLGTFNCGGSWYVYDGATVRLGDSVLTNFIASTPSNITILGSSAHFGDITIGTPTTPSTYTMYASSSWEIWGRDTTINSASVLNLNCGLILVGNITLNGTLNAGNQTVTIYNMTNNGILNIDGGFMEIYLTYNNYGTLNINTGTLSSGTVIYVRAGSVTNMGASGKIICRGLDAPVAGTFQLATGTVVFDNFNTFPGDDPEKAAIRVSNGNYLPNVILDAGDLNYYYLNADLTIKRSLSILSGGFRAHGLSSNVYNIYVAENWSNTGGVFYPSTGRVVFNGGGFQAIKTSEAFNIIEVAKIVAGGGGDALRIESGTAGAHIVVTCDSYDWTSGDLDVNVRGTFTALDLADNGMYGGFYCAAGCVMNLTQDAAQTINLFGTIQVTGGIMNIYGGNGDAKWAGSSASNVKITSGALHYHDQGLQIRNAFALTYDINGGTVSTVGDIYCNRTGFNPTGGSFEMRGNTDKQLDFQGATNSSLFNLVINKDSASRRISQNASIQTISGQLHIYKGTYYMTNRTLDCLGDLSVNADGKLHCNNANTVKIDDNSAIKVLAGGVIEVVGFGTAASTTFTHSGTGRYAFTVYSEGSLSVDWATFEYMDINGVNIDGGTVSSLDNCIFQNGAPGGCLLKIGGSQAFTVNNANFPTNAGGGAKNVKKTDNFGSVYFSNWTGVFGGPAFEQDDYNLIYWQGTGIPQIDDLVITYLPATNKVQLNWSYPLPVTGFTIYRSLDPEATFTSHATTTNTIWSEVVPGPKYFYYVRAVTP